MSRCQYFQTDLHNTVSKNKSQQASFIDIDKLILKVIWKCKEQRMSKQFWKKKTLKKKKKKPWKSLVLLSSDPFYIMTLSCSLKYEFECINIPVLKILCQFPFALMIESYPKKKKKKKKGPHSPFRHQRWSVSVLF